MGCRAWLVAFAEFVSHEVRSEGVYATAPTPKQACVIEPVVGRCDLAGVVRQAREPATPARASATVECAMTAKEKLRERIEGLTEEEASEALRLLELRADPVIAAFRDARVDDEPWSEQDEAAAAEGRADLAAGRTVGLDEALREDG